MLRVIETINDSVKTPRAAIILAVLPASWQFWLALVPYLSILCLVTL
jgi:hypothetical protein